MKQNECATAYEWPPQALGMSSQRAIYFDLPQTRPAIHLLPRQCNPFLPTTSFCDALYSDTFIYLLKSFFRCPPCCVPGVFLTYEYENLVKSICARMQIQHYTNKTKTHTHKHTHIRLYAFDWKRIRTHAGNLNRKRFVINKIAKQPTHTSWHERQVWLKLKLKLKLWQATETAAHQEAGREARIGKKEARRQDAALLTT